MTTGSKGRLTHGAYMDRLRKAFLLRAHPDRFRGRPDAVRKSQANLISALMDRMTDRDFHAYAAGSVLGGGSPVTRDGAAGYNNNYSYVLEKRDGSLLKQTIDLSSPALEILHHLAKALEKVSATVPQAPPPPEGILQEDDRELWTNLQRGGSFSGGSMKSSRFNVKSNQGRNLSHFLETLDIDQVKMNRTDRMDATAAAPVVRRLYSFQAVDGIGLGWSSRSFAMLLKNLINLHEEHNSTFHVKTFYPLRLVFSNNESRERLDLYGGEMFLHPAWTPLQWLEESLQMVTSDSLLELEHNRTILKERQHIVEARYGGKCLVLLYSNRKYILCFLFIQRYPMA